MCDEKDIFKKKNTLITIFYTGIFFQAITVDKVFQVCQDLISLKGYYVIKISHFLFTILHCAMQVLVYRYWTCKRDWGDPL